MNCTGTVKCHTGVALRGWSHLHLSPTETPLSCWQVWFRTCRAQLGPNSTSAGWCVRKGPGRAHIIQAQVKPQHIGSENCKSGDTLRSVPPSPIPDRLSRAHHCQTKNPFSCRFYPTHTKNHYFLPNTCITKLRVYTCL
jgi:hypothetical protein